MFFLHEKLNKIGYFTLKLTKSNFGHAHFHIWAIRVKILKTLIPCDFIDIDVNCYDFWHEKLNKMSYLTLKLTQGHFWPHFWPHPGPYMMGD